MPALSTIHIDQALTNVSVAYKNESLIADQIMPPLPVAKRSDKYFVYDKGAFLSASQKDANGNPTSLRRPKTKAAEVDYSLSTQAFYAEEYALRHLVADAELAYADNPLQPDLDATVKVTEQLLLDNETKVAALVANRSNYSSSNKAALTTGGTGTSWASYTSANSLPITNIRNAKIQVLKGVMKEANTMLITVDAARTLADHPTLVEYIKYTHPDALTTSGLPKVIKGLDVVEASQQVNTAADGATFASGDVWLADDGSTMALIYYRNSDVSPRSVHYGRTFDAPDDTTGARGLSVRRYRDEARKGTWIEGAFMRDWKLISLDGSGGSAAGYLITGCNA